MDRRLGKTQIAFLAAMKKTSYRRERGYSEGCGWVWGTHSQSVRIADSLVKRGLLAVDGRGTYTLTDAGLAYSDPAREGTVAPVGAPVDDDERRRYLAWCTLKGVRPTAAAEALYVEQG